MANLRTCKAFPQIKSKKEAAAENRLNLSILKKAIPGLTFANVTNSEQQRTALVDKNRAGEEIETSFGVINQEGETTSYFILAMSEFRKLFQNFPGLIEAGKAHSKLQKAPRKD
ncbi:hypothetical protein TNCV_1953801 [Trichonephila clavipes]|nr:hypothetical protein TNCV_1953801 [Trichonephila clavipes]